MMTKYNFGKTIEKMIWITAEMLLSGAIVLATEQPAWMFMMPVFEGLRNIVKFKIANKK